MDDPGWDKRGLFFHAPWTMSDIKKVQGTVISAFVSWSTIQMQKTKP